MKECPKCNTLMKESDFLKKDICYKCLYKIKMRNASEKKCKWCGKNSVMKGRWAYCSLECADQSAVHMKKSYWTNHITIEKQSWKESLIS